MRVLVNRPRDSWFRFPRAFANDSLCCPSRATLLSGQYSHNHGVTSNELASQFRAATAVPVWLT
jgi:N-acetylglucosamine-6-sulfatase